MIIDGIRQIRIKKIGNNIVKGETTEKRRLSIVAPFCKRVKL